jgi:hypothetical protein
MLARFDSGRFYLLGVKRTLEAILDRFAACFEDLDDPRTGNAALHDFHTLLIIALCTVPCGGQGCVDMALFAKAKEPFLREFLDLKNGPPSHDTFSRMFRRLDPDQFRIAFQRVHDSVFRDLPGWNRDRR